MGGMLTMESYMLLYMGDWWGFLALIPASLLFYYGFRR
jgi:hypothetical protein